jgi:hypothetical protein
MIRGKNEMSMYTVRITTDTTIQVTFSVITSTVTIDVGLGGSATVDGVTIAGGTSHTMTLPAGDAFVLEVTPDAGFYVVVSVDGVAIQPDA